MHHCRWVAFHFCNPRHWYFICCRWPLFCWLFQMTALCNQKRHQGCGHNSGPILLIFLGGHIFCIILMFLGWCHFLKTKPVFPCQGAFVAFGCAGVCPGFFNPQCAFAIQHAFFGHCWFSSGHLLPMDQGKIKHNNQPVCTGRSCHKFLLGQHEFQEI